MQILTLQHFRKNLQLNFKLLKFLWKKNNLLN